MLDKYSTIQEFKLKNQVYKIEINLLILIQHTLQVVLNYFVVGVVNQYSKKNANRRNLQFNNKE